jgi:hypothetical protein
MDGFAVAKVGGQRVESGQSQTNERAEREAKLGGEKGACTVDRPKIFSPL